MSILADEERTKLEGDVRFAEGETAALKDQLRALLANHRERTRGYGPRAPEAVSSLLSLHNALEKLVGEDSAPVAVQGASVSGPEHGRDSGPPSGATSATGATLVERLRAFGRCWPNVDSNIYQACTEAAAAIESLTAERDFAREKRNQWQDAAARWHDGLHGAQLKCAALEAERDAALAKVETARVRDAQWQSRVGALRLWWAHGSAPLENDNERAAAMTPLEGGS